jgi:hypothetical protein
MDVRIYQPAKNAMQSGRGNSRQWVVEYEPGEAKRADALMGWIGSGDMRGQLELSFDSRDEAVAYAERNGLSYHVREPNLRRSRPKNYADNFRYDRVD